VKPKRTLSYYSDKILLSLALAAFVWLGTSSIFAIREMETLTRSVQPLLSDKKVNAETWEAEAPEGGEQIWLPAVSQNRGEDWVFDVFTPPVIYYDPSSREFAVTPPNPENESFTDYAWLAFDIELLEVKPRPYRLQLVGYQGKLGSFVANLENTSTGEILLLREGEESPELGVRLVEFEERQFRVTGEEEDTPVIQTVGIARLNDYAAGEDVSLTNLETKIFSDLQARIRLMPQGFVRYVEIGSQLELESGIYLVEDLSADPQQATVSKTSKDGERRVSRTLRPAGFIEEAPGGDRGSGRRRLPVAASASDSSL